MSAKHVGWVERSDDATPWVRRAREVVGRRGRSTHQRCGERAQADGCVDPRPSAAAPVAWHLPGMTFAARAGITNVALSPVESAN